MKSWLHSNDIEIYSTNDEGKPIIDVRFIRTLKNKTCKHMSSISKNLYVDKLNDVVNKYNNRYLSTIKMKPGNVKDNAYYGSGKKVHNTDPRLKFGDHVRTSKYKNIFKKRCTVN